MGAVEYLEGFANKSKLTIWAPILSIIIGVIYFIVHYWIPAVLDDEGLFGSQGGFILAIIGVVLGILTLIAAKKSIGILFGYACLIIFLIVGIMFIMNIEMLSSWY